MIVNSSNPYRYEFKKLKLQYPTVTARLHAEIDEKITIFFGVKKFSKSKIFKIENIFKVDYIEDKIIQQQQLLN